MSEQPIGVAAENINRILDRHHQTLRDAVNKELQAADQVPAAPGDSGLDSLHANFQKLAQSFTQVDLLTTLLECSATCAPRVILFISKGGSLYGWAARGFGPGFESQVKKVKWAVESYPELTRVVLQREMIMTNFSDLSDLGDQISGFDEYAPLKSAFYPIQVRGKVAAVLYADSGSETNLAESLALDMLTYFAGHELTMITMKLKKEGDYKTREIPVSEPPKAAPPAPKPKPVAPAPAPEPEIDFDEEQEPDPVFVTPPPPPEAHAAPVKAPAAPVEEDRNIKKAKRVARVLVSDIKLYHENEVALGQQRGNMYKLLREDIDRSFHHFKERTENIAPAGSNYFKDELIRQLADGNVELLGDLPF